MAALVEQRLAEQSTPEEIERLLGELEGLSDSDEKSCFRIE